MAILKNKKKVKTTEEFLMTVANDTELSLVEGILRYEGIPFIKKYMNAGDYATLYLGFTNLGIEIYVSDEDLQKARDAIHKNCNAVEEDITKDVT